MWSKISQRGNTPSYESMVCTHSTNCVQQNNVQTIIIIITTSSSTRHNLIDFNTDCTLNGIQ